MKTFCPHCGILYDIDEKYTGKSITCQRCSSDFIVYPANDGSGNNRSPKPSVPPSAPAASSRLTTCPDCGQSVSVRASSCPHCGAPLNAPMPPVYPQQQSAPQPPVYPQQQSAPMADVSQQGVFTKNIATLERNKIADICGAILVILTFLFFMLGTDAAVEESYKFYLIGFITLICAIGCFAGFRTISCTRCGYHGRALQHGGPNGCAFILLLCIGIVPGLIYMFAVPTHYKCPNCGQEAFK